MRGKQILASYLGCLLAYALDMGATAYDQDKPFSFTISEETTYITEPCTSDGLVDYATALEQPLSEGVTAENNAAVLFYQALGPRPGDDPLRDAFFRRLGMPRPDEAGPYLMSYPDYLRQELGITVRDASFDRYMEDREQTTKRQGRSWRPGGDADDLVVQISGAD